MRRITAGIGVIAMFAALLTAPLYHLHERGDHHEPISLVHAHFPESEEPDHHSDGIEDQHGHSGARYVDIFTFNEPPASTQLVAELTTTSLETVLSTSAGVSLEAIPQSHGPPPARPSSPRSPPSA